MVKERTNKKKVTGSNERGITPSKVAYAYGVSLETLQKWIINSPALRALEREEREEEGYNSQLSFTNRKWTPKQLQLIFYEFGDPRQYWEIIDSNFIT